MGGDRKDIKVEEKKETTQTTPTPSTPTPVPATVTKAEGAEGGALRDSVETKNQPAAEQSVLANWLGFNPFKESDAREKGKASEYTAPKIEDKIDKNVCSDSVIKAAQGVSGIGGQSAEIREKMKEQVARDVKDGVLKSADLDKPMTFGAVLVGIGAVTPQELNEAREQRNKLAEQATKEGKREPNLIDVLKEKFKDNPEKLASVDKAVLFYETMRAEMAKPKSEAPKPADGEKKELAKVDEAAKPKDAKVEEFELAKLPPEKQKEIQTLRTLQGTIVKMSGEKGFFADENERKQFLEKLSADMAKVKPGGSDKGLVFEKLPEMGKATQEGYEKLVRFLQSPEGAIMRRYNNLDALQLKDVPDMKFELVGRDLGVLKSRDQVRQELAQGKGSLGIDTGDVKNIDKLAKNVDKITDVVSWLGDVDKSVHDEVIERKSVVLSRMLERGIEDGRFPPGWRRPENMDKETWCSAVDQTMNTYNRFSKITEAINHVKRADVGYKTDAFDNMPKPGEGKKGIGISYDKHNRSTNVSFGDMMVQDISTLSAKNSPILAELNAWSDKYEAEGKQALQELLRAQGQPGEGGYQAVPHSAIGFGKCEINNGHVNPKMHAWSKDQNPTKGEGWKHFNLMTFDMEIKNELDQFGKVAKVLITPDCRFHEVPPGPLGYCNFVKFGVHSENQEKPLEYLPKQWAAVQTGPQQVEMMHAEDVADWKSLQQLKEFASTATIVVMDGAMVASGGIAVAGAKQMVKMGVKTAMVEGAEYLSTKAMTEIPGAMVKEIAKRQMAKGLFEIGMGVAGPWTHGAGSHEVPILKIGGDLRTAYFIGSGATALASWVRAPQAASAVLRAGSPRAAEGVEGVINSIRGTEATREAMHLAQTGALKNLGEGWLGAEKAVHKAFSYSEAAFIGQFLWDSSHMYNESQKNFRPWTYDQAQKAFIQADLSDNTAVQKFVEKGPSKQDVLELHLKDYKESLGPLSKESADTIDGIMAKVKELSGPNATPEQKQAYVQELMKHFRYSGEQIKTMRSAATEKYVNEHPLKNDEDKRSTYIDQVKNYEPHSEADYLEKSQKDSASFDPNVRKMAALASLVLSRAEDGQLPEVLAKREVTTGGFTVDVPPGKDSKDRKTTTVEKPARTISQDLTLKEAYDQVMLDLHRDPDLKSRTQKAGVLAETGLIAREHYASLLLTQLDGTAGDVSKPEQMRALVELGRTINKLEIEEMARTKQMGEQDLYTAKGLTAGLTATDLKARLKEITPTLSDETLKTTAQFTLDFLNKPHLDSVDRQRFNDVFFKKDAGISPADYQKQLREDMASKPTDQAGWERKLIASGRLLEDLANKSSFGEEGKEASKAAMEIFKSIDEAAKSSPFSAIKIKAVEMLLGKSDSGSPNIQALAIRVSEGGQIDGKNPPDLRKAFLSTSMNLLTADGIKDDANLAPLQRSEAARAREQLINLMTSYVKDSGPELKTIRSVYEVNLAGMVDRKDGSSVDPYVEVRAAAIRSLGTLQYGNKANLELMRMSLDPKIEPSPIVRMEAVAGVEKLIPNSKQRQEILGPLAVKEPDFAVQERLRPYYRPSGNLGDANSQKSRQEVIDLTVEHDKAEIPSGDIKDWLSKTAPSVLEHKSIFDYFDRNRYWEGYMFGAKNNYATTFEKEWNDFKGWAETTGLLGWKDYWDESKIKSGNEALIRMEAAAQVFALRAYRDGVESLAKQAEGTGGGVVLGKGDGAHTVTSQQAAILGLGYLLQSPPQMGEAFYKHRTSRDMNVTDEQLKYDDFSPSQKSMRRESVEKGWYLSKIDNTGYRKNGIMPPEGDPWPEMQLKVAKHMNDLATSTGELPTLTKQIIASLDNPNLKNDDARVMLVDALDKIVSRKDVHPSVVQYVAREMGRMVGSTKEVQKVDGQQQPVELKTKSMQAMIDFLSEHGIKKGPNDSASAFEPYSDEANKIRVALNTRMREASKSTPVPVRVRANELYERQWQSVIDVMDHRPPLDTVSPKDKLAMLPADPSILTKEYLKSKLTDVKESGIDEIVNSNVQAIVDATKGDTLKTGDPRIAALEELTSDKYHDRIRMAAALALTTTTEGNLGTGALESIALNSDIAAYRHDAMRALERLNVKSFVSDGSLVEAKDRFASRIFEAQQKLMASDKSKMKFENLSEEQLKTKSNAELIKIAQDYIKQVNKDSSPELKNNAFELRQALHAYGSRLTNIGAMQLNGGKDYYTQAEANLTDGLAAFGVDAARLAELKQPFNSARSDDKHMPFSQDGINSDASPFKKMADALTQNLLQTEIFDDVKKTDGNLELHTQELPSLILGLNKFAQLTTSRFLQKEGGKFDTNKLDATLGVLALSDVLTQRAYPHGTGQQSESYMQIAKSFRMLAQANLHQGEKNPISWRFYEPLKTYHDKADADLNAMKNMDPTNLRITPMISALREEQMDALAVRMIADNKALTGLKDYSRTRKLEQLKSESEEMDKLYQSHPDKQSVNAHFRLSLKNMLDAQREPDAAKKQSLYEKANTETQEAIKLAGLKYGTNSPAFTSTVNRLIMLSKEANQPKWAEDFINKGLQSAEKSNDAQLKLTMLRHKANFLNTHGRQAEKDQTVRDYVELKKQLDAKREGEQ